MGLKDLMGAALKAATCIGTVSGSDFPLGTKINIKIDGSERSLLFTYPNKEEYVVTRDKVKSAQVLAMGVIDIKSGSGNSSTSVYGTKYKIELTDGKVAILTVGLGDTLYQIEHIIF